MDIDGDYKWVIQQYIEDHRGVFEIYLWALNMFMSQIHVDF